MDTIHCVPAQYGVYSVKIGSILLQTVAEIESIAKDLYTNHTGKPKDRIHFDHVALKALGESWTLEKKIVDIATISFYGTDIDRVLTPLKKNVTIGGNRNWAWNDAYQNLKHNRIDNLNKGNIGNLLQAASALFLLNVYFDHNDVDLGDDNEGKQFRNDRGSDLFSIRTISVGTGFNKEGKCYVVGDTTSFDESTYLIAPTVETFERQAVELVSLMETINTEVNARAGRKIVDAIGSQHVPVPSDVAGLQKLFQQFQVEQSNKSQIERMLVENRKARESAIQLTKNNEYRAVLNKHDLPTNLDDGHSS